MLDKLFNKKNEANFKKHNRDLFIDQQGGGGLVDQNYLFKINLLFFFFFSSSIQQHRDELFI